MNETWNPLLNWIQIFSMKTKTRQIPSAPREINIFPLKIIKKKKVMSKKILSVAIDFQSSYYFILHRAGSRVFFKF